MSTNNSTLDEVKCEKNSEKCGSKRSIIDNAEFATVVKNGDRDKVTMFLKNGFCLTDTIDIEEKNSRKHVTVIEYIMKYWPRPVQYLTHLFDEQITKNDKDIDCYDCEIYIDFNILLQPDGSARSDMKVLKNLLKNTKNYKTNLMSHPLISSFLHMKWIDRLKSFYKIFVSLYFLFVVCLTWIVLTIYIQTKHNYVHKIYLISYFLVTCMIIQELFFIAVTIWTGNFISSIKKPIWLLNWTSKALWVVVVNTDHYILNRDWPKIVTAAAILFAWLEITVLLSHFPECGYLFHIFSIVVNRALKVYLLFGFQILMGFSLAFYVMFCGQTPFNNFLDTFAKVIVMTYELDYESMISGMSSFKNKLILQVIILVFIFFVSVVMMNLLLAIIINDTGDLKINGKNKRICNTIELVDILDNVLDIAASIIEIERKKMKTGWKIYPGRPIRVDDVLSPEVQEKMTNIFMKKD